MVVGDPSQIKPAPTAAWGRACPASSMNRCPRVSGPRCLHMREKLANVELMTGIARLIQFHAASITAQTLVDAASRYGFYRKRDLDEDSWIGIPLWVHRRCQDPPQFLGELIGGVGKGRDHIDHILFFWVLDPRVLLHELLDLLRC